MEFRYSYYTYIYKENVLINKGLMRIKFEVQ